MDPRILDKIKKCLALSNSPEPHEAAAAMRQAQKLMDHYGVSQADLHLHEIQGVEVKSKASVSKVKDWELALVSLISKAFGCRIMWASSHSNAEDVYGHFTLVGQKGRVELAQYTCEVLQRKLVKARAAFVASLPGHTLRSDKVRQGDGFCHGWVTAVAKTVQEFALPDEQRSAIDQFIADRTGSRKANVQNRSCGVAGFHAGQAAGSKESLHRPINTAPTNQRRLASS